MHLRPLIPFMRRFRASLLVVALAALITPIAASPAARAADGTSVCTATGTLPINNGEYTLQSEWTGGFNGVVDIKNTGSAAVNGWSLGFTFGGDQKVTNFYSTALTQSGAKVTAANLAYNSAIAPAADVTFGFQGTWAASDAAPSGFTLNGTPCG